MTDAACPASAPASAPWNSACSSNFSMGAELGVAWLGMLCQYKASTQGDQTVSGANVVSATQDEWKVLAHEIGHGFGAYHDCTSQLCSSTQTCCPLSASTCDASQQFIV